MDARLLLTLVVALPLSAAGKPPPDPPLALKLGKGDRLITRGGTGGICGLDYSPDGTLLATAGGDKVIRLWELETMKELRRLEGHESFIRKVTFSPDGKQLVSAGNDASAILWDVATGKEIRRIGKHTNGMRTAVFSPDGKTLATSAFDEHIGLWDVATGKKLHFFRAHPRVPYSVAFSPDGKTLVSGGDSEGTIRLWDVATARPLRSWEGHTGCVYSVAFSPDGRLLASGGGDTAARVWEAATGKEVRRLEGHKGGVSRATFSPDGRTLLSASHEETVHLWETMTGREIRRFGNHAGWVWGLGYAPSGRTVASSGADGATVVWDLGSDALAPQRRPVQLTAADLNAAWRDLAGADAGRALQAAFALSGGSPREVVPFLRARLRPAAPPALVDADRLERLIRDLDARAFKTRERAYNELVRLGNQVSHALRRALASQPPLEVRRRLEELLAKLETNDIPPELLQAVRALRVLEDFRTQESTLLLKELAAGWTDHLLTQEAAAALARLAGRSPAP